MKGKNLADVQSAYRETVVGVCLTCQKPQHGYWGRYGNGGVCSRKCADAHEASLSIKNADLRVFTKGV